MRLTRSQIVTRTASLVRSNLKEERILGVLTVCLSLLFLVGCASNQSAKFKEAGCAAADVAERKFDEAAVQFGLAADNGDPDAVKASMAAQRIQEVFYSGNADLSDFDSDFAEVKSLAVDIISYCGSEYDIGRIW
jgi:hypothetical protein